MYLRSVTLFKRKVKIMIDSDVFVMPANLRIIGRRICKWLKYHITNISHPAVFCNKNEKWSIDVNIDDITFLNNYLTFPIRSLFLEFHGVNSTLTLDVRFES